MKLNFVASCQSQPDQQLRFASQKKRGERKLNFRKRLEGFCDYYANCGCFCEGLIVWLWPRVVSPSTEIVHKFKLIIAHLDIEQSASAFSKAINLQIFYLFSSLSIENARPLTAVKVALSPRPM